MTYRRVLPRDLFNEANLLKCYGQLWLKTDGMRGTGFREEDVAEFEIVQDGNSGALTVANLTFVVRGWVCPLSRPLNSRRPWPLYLTAPDGDEIDIFDDGGDLTAQMQQFLAGSA